MSDEHVIIPSILQDNLLFRVETSVGHVYGLRHYKYGSGYKDHHTKTRMSDVFRD